MTLEQMKVLDELAAKKTLVFVDYVQRPPYMYSPTLASVKGHLHRWCLGIGWGVVLEADPHGWGKIRINDEVSINVHDSASETNFANIRVFVKGEFEKIEPGSEWDKIADLRRAQTGAGEAYSDTK